METSLNYVLVYCKVLCSLLFVLPVVYIARMLLQQEEQD